MVQVLLVLLIIVLGFLVFKFYPLKKVETKDVVLSAIFIMITLVCKRFFTVMVPLFGVESLKIGLEYIPLMIAGYFLAPGYAYLIGLCCDLVGLIIVPTSTTFFGFTLTMILVSLIPSLIKENIKDISENKICFIVQGLVIILGLSASIYIYRINRIKLTDTMYTLTFMNKMMLISICCILVLAFILLIRALRKKISDDEAKTFSTWILCVSVVEIVCTLILTPLWLNIMYGIPFFISLCIRIIKECIIIPLEIFIGYTIIKILNRIILKN